MYYKLSDMTLKMSDKNLGFAQHPEESNYWSNTAKTRNANHAPNQFSLTVMLTKEITFSAIKSEINIHPVIGYILVFLWISCCRLLLFVCFVLLLFVLFLLLFASFFCFFCWVKGLIGS